MGQHTRRVAVIGAGPGGLVAARYLKSEQFEPVIFEKGERLGGQWSGDADCSGVWPGMRTNTSRIMTAFSDLPHAADAPTYLTGGEVGQYLQRYAQLFDLIPHIRLAESVREIRRDPKGGWKVETDRLNQRFEHVIVAGGRFHKPAIPNIPGISTFSGCRGVIHANCHSNPQAYRGLRVLVAGCNTSSLEIASDLATLGASQVTVTHRNQRYVVPKLVKGVPVDHLAFNRYSAWAEQSFSAEVNSAALKHLVLEMAGRPEQFGAPAPQEDIAAAKIARSQFFLPLVAEGRISVKPWISGVEHDLVQFSDGSAERFDGIILGTGYQLHLPFFGTEIRSALNAGPQSLDLYKFTFHPELPGLAFLGYYELAGPYFPVLELQARWIAYTLSGARPSPSREELEAGVAVSAARRRDPQATANHTAAILFSRAAGVEPEFARWPELARAFFFGPLAPVSFRMSGRDSLADAPQRFAQEAGAFGCMPSLDLTPAEIGKLQVLADAMGDELFRRYVADLIPDVAMRSIARYIC